MAVFTGIVVVVLIKPGKTLGSTSAPTSGEKEAMPTVDAFLDLIRYPWKGINSWIRLLLWIWTIASSAASLLQEHVSLESGGGLFWTGETLGVVLLFFHHFHYGTWQQRCLLFFSPISQYKTVYSKNTSLGKVNLTQTTDLSKTDHVTKHLCMIYIVLLLFLLMGFVMVTLETPQITRCRCRAP